jgi:CRP/FNR family transcriptional regulator
MFGEMALIDELPRSATATAIEPTLAFVIPIFDFRAVLLRSPDAAAALLAQLSLRIREAEAAR